MNPDSWNGLRGAAWFIVTVTTWLLFLFTFILVTLGKISPWHQALPLALVTILFAAGAPRNVKK